MNAIDLGVLGVIALSGIFAFARGLRARNPVDCGLGRRGADYALRVQSTSMGWSCRFVSTPLLADLVAGAGLFVVGSDLVDDHYGISGAPCPLDLAVADRSDLGIGLRPGARCGRLSRSPISCLDVSLPPNDRPGWIRQAKSEAVSCSGRRHVARSAAAIAPDQKCSRRSMTRSGRSNEPRKLRRRCGLFRARPRHRRRSRAKIQAPNYKTGDRRDMDRLIENAR